MFRYTFQKAKKQFSIKFSNLIFFLLAVGLITGMITGCQQSPETTTVDQLTGPMVLLLMRLESDESELSAYFLDPDKDQLYLSPGKYYGEALYPDETVAALPAFLVEAGEGEQTLVDLVNLPMVSLAGSDVSQQLAAIASFLLAVDNVRLTYLKTISAEFTTPLFDPAFEPSWEAVEKLEEAFTYLGDEAQVTRAAQAFITRGTSAANQPGKKGLSSNISGPLDILKNIASFFGICKDEDEIASEEMITTLQAAEKYDEKTEILEVINLYYPKVTSLDAFVQDLKDGKVENSRYIRQQLLQQTPYHGIFQTLNPDVNRADGETLHRVGAEALTRGSELNIAIVKEVLNTVFPGMDKGFEYADKVNEFAEFVRDFYHDPASAIGGVIKGQAEEAVKNRIKDQFMTLFPNLSEDEADAVVGQIVEEINEVQEALEEIEEELQDEQEEDENIDVDDDEQAAEPPSLPPGTSLETETFTENGVTYTFFEGHGTYCDEAEGTYVFRWSLDLMQEVEKNHILGTVKFHDCPGGGRVLYRVEGAKNDDGTFSLLGDKKDGGGGLYDSAPASTQFNFDPVTGVITPNYAP